MRTSATAGDASGSARSGVSGQQVWSWRRRTRVDSEAMEEALQRAQELVAAWDEELRRELPDGAEIFDAHVHLGDDIDGMSGRYEDLLRLMGAYGVSRAFMFCMDEPDRHPGFRAPNDRTP